MIAYRAHLMKENSDAIMYKIQTESMIPKRAMVWPVISDRLLNSHAKPTFLFLFSPRPSFQDQELVSQTTTTTTTTHHGGASRLLSAIIVIPAAAMARSLIRRRKLQSSAEAAAAAMAHGTPLQGTRCPERIGTAITETPWKFHGAVW